MTFTPRQRGLSLAAVIAASFGVGLSFGVGFPLTALTFEAWHQPKWMIGLAGASPAIAVLVALPIMPSLVARLGAVTAIAGGCLAGAVGFLALYAFQSPWAWIVIRLLMSAGFALPWLAGETWINTVAREETRGRVIAIYAIAFFTGFSTGPIILQTLGLTGLWPFLVGAAGTAVAGVPILLARRLAPEFCHDGSRSFISAMGLAPVAMAGAFIGGFAEISNLSLIPNVALAAGLSPEAALGLLSTMTAGGVALQFPIGWLSDKVPRFAVTIALAIAFIVLALALPTALTMPLAADYRRVSARWGHSRLLYGRPGDRRRARRRQRSRCRECGLPGHVSSRRHHRATCRRNRDDGIACHRLCRDSRDVNGRLRNRPDGVRRGRAAPYTILTRRASPDRG